MTSHNPYVSLGVRAAAIAGAAAVVLVLAGCNSGEQPNVGRSSSTATEAATQTATPTQTPTAVFRPADATGPAENVPVPLIPEVAKTETKDGAKAFASYWFSVLSYAYESQLLSADWLTGEESLEIDPSWNAKEISSLAFETVNPRHPSTRGVSLRVGRKEGPDGRAGRARAGGRQSSVGRFPGGRQLEKRSSFFMK